VYFPGVAARQIYWPRKMLVGVNLVFPVVTVLGGMPLWMMWVCFAVHMALVYALSAPTCRWLGPAVTRFRTREREVWLTIDDGPDGERTVELAAQLQRRGVRATFFVEGRRLEEGAELAMQLMESGHTLANHTYSHPVRSFWLLWPSVLRAEIDRCDAVLEKAGVKLRRWFRAPLGLKHFLLCAELEKRGMRLVAWNVRGHDGLVCRPEAVTQRVLKGLAPGAIILLHEGRAASLAAVLQVVDAVLARGYRFVIPEDATLE
jgi:peptidoglycan/xylan/chitin deacetylase (PgdA/CDA1 family)